MPRNVRNFWIELMVDGKATKVATGPRRKDGGFLLKVKVRREGSISAQELTIRGEAHTNGEDISVTAYVNGESEIFSEGGPTATLLQDAMLQLTSKR